MTTTVASVLNNVKTILNDASLVYWTQDELLAWGSEGQLELVSKVDPSAATKTISHALVAGARQVAPADCLGIIDIAQNANGATVSPCDRAALQSFNAAWMTEPTASTVQHWMPDSERDVFYVYPAQRNTPATVKLTYSFAPTALTIGGNLGVADQFATNIENYILFRAFSKDSEGGHAERAAAYANAFYGAAK